jgi:hypothetical protein
MLHSIRQVTSHSDVFVREYCVTESEFSFSPVKSAEKNEPGVYGGSTTASNIFS